MYEYTNKIVCKSSFILKFLDHISLSKGNYFHQKYFLKRDPRATQKPTWEPQTRRVARDTAAQSFNFHRKHVGGPTKNCDFPELQAYLQYGPFEVLPVL